MEKYYLCPRGKIAMSEKYTDHPSQKMSKFDEGTNQSLLNTSTMGASSSSQKTKALGKITTCYHS